MIFPGASTISNLLLLKTRCAVFERARRALRISLPRRLSFFTTSSAKMSHGESLILLSSSPELPSLGDLLASKAHKQSTLRSGSNVAPIPRDAPSAFTTTASIWKNTLQVEDDGFSDHEISSPKPSKAAAKLADLSPNTSHVGMMTKRTGTPSAKPKSATAKQIPKRTVDAESLDDLSISEASVPAKRGRKPKPKSDTVQTTIPKSKVTKPPGKEKVTKKKADTVSRHFAPPAPAVLSPVIEDEAVVLEPAMARRLDWTPPRESAHGEILGDSSALKEVTSQDDSGVWPGDSPPANVFKSLRDSFAHIVDDALPSNEASVQAPADVLGKRKLLHMINTSTSLSTTTGKATTPEVSPVKQKAPKKKPRTITELAMAAYQSEKEAEPEKPNRNSMLGYLEVVDDKGAPVNNETGAKGKRGRKPAKPKVSKKKPEPKKEILLSPTSALAQVSRQDFVFGTASQLATEDDPDLLRALHQAMNMSNEIDHDVFLSSSPVNNGLAVRRKSGGKLWRAGARDEEGDLLDVEVLDLTVSSPIDEDVDLPSNPLPSNKERVPSPPLEPLEPPAPSSPPLAHPKICAIIPSSDTFDLTESPVVAIPKSHVFTTQSASPLAQKAQSEIALLRPVLPEDLTWGEDESDSELPPPSNQEQYLLTQSNSPRNKQPVAQETAQPVPPSPEALPEVPESSRVIDPPDMPSRDIPRPKYELYTDAQLARDISRYGFKPVKKRTAMIALLDQCWASKQQTGQGSSVMMMTSATTAAMSTTSAPQSPVRLKSPRVVRLSPRPPTPKKIDPAKKKIGKYAKHTVVELKKLLKERGLRISGTKPVLISRLEEYDNNQVVRTVADAIAKLVSSPAKTPPRPKPSKKGRSEAIEIADSDAEFDEDGPFLSSPITPQKRAAQEDLSSPAQPQEDQEDIDSDDPKETDAEAVGDMSLMEEPTTQQLSVFSYITKAVTSAPRTKDPTNPSWYEKMLMYDPVILEELADWLNSGPLEKAGYRAKVAPDDVKSWCERKSVHYLKKISNKGRDRRRENVNVRVSEGLHSLLSPNIPPLFFSCHRSQLVLVFKMNRLFHRPRSSREILTSSLLTTPLCRLLTRQSISSLTPTHSPLNLISRQQQQHPSQRSYRKRCYSQEGGSDPFQSLVPTDQDIKNTLLPKGPKSAMNPRNLGAQKVVTRPAPSASVILISPQNEVLLLHRVQSSSAFPSAHVFPGGNVDRFHDDLDGSMVESKSSVDYTKSWWFSESDIFRRAAIRETFEEAGILLAVDDKTKQLVDLPDTLIAEQRKEVHASRKRFGDFVASVGGMLDTEKLIPFTRWVTPANQKKRFITQMYVYMLPLDLDEKKILQQSKATSDGGVEHTSAEWASPEEWLRRCHAGDIKLYPPQYYLLYILANTFRWAVQDAPHNPRLPWQQKLKERLTSQRERFMRFLQMVPTDVQDDFHGRRREKAEPRFNRKTRFIPWGEKTISPRVIWPELSGWDKRTVLALDHPGPEFREYVVTEDDVKRKEEIEERRKELLKTKAGFRADMAKLQKEFAELWSASAEEAKEEEEADWRTQDELAKLAAEEEQLHKEVLKGGDGARCILVRMDPKQGMMPVDMGVRWKDQVMAEREAWIVTERKNAAERKIIMAKEQSERDTAAFQKKLAEDKKFAQKYERKKRRKERLLAERQEARWASSKQFYKQVLGKQVVTKEEAEGDLEKFEDLVLQKWNGPTDECQVVSSESQHRGPTKKTRKELTKVRSALTMQEFRRRRQGGKKGSLL
ncbi:hypothetical protein QBC35DRAFT_440353 [Podospora australis]|uniref:Structure-specific endonuclease subunit SLX4 n=1 Tax=Podospora australis TaxID=1536484 RepID=A0AAN6WPB4_9PEZI|nr:hypothetical protein QBC35DRAFT_440353 [Podospora australis]